MPRAHKAFTENLHFCLSADISTDLRHVFFDRPLFLFPGGVHLKATIGISDVSFLRTLPIHFHRFSFIWTKTFFKKRPELLLNWCREGVGCTILANEDGLDEADLIRVVAIVAQVSNVTPRPLLLFINLDDNSYLRCNKYYSINGVNMIKNAQI